MSNVIQCNACGKTYNPRDHEFGRASDYPPIAVIAIHDSRATIGDPNKSHACSRECAIRVAKISIDRYFDDAKSNEESHPSETPRSS